ncbi:MAG: histidine kinase, partial [Rhodospirillaceae bacterium]|nr:histidine kinase [Rhodospirillaceae bacterium]
MLGPSSPILKRILAINMLALAILVAGLMYLGEYRKSLIASELASLSVHGEMLAAALGESVIADDEEKSEELRP